MREAVVGVVAVPPVVAAAPAELEEGQIVEDGTHAELSQAGGVYETLWDRQTGAFLEAE